VTATVPPGASAGGPPEPGLDPARPDGPAGVDAVDPTSVPPPGRRRRTRRRVVAWSAGAVLVIFAVLLALFATVGTVKAHSRLLGNAAPPVAGTELGTSHAISLRQFAGRWVLVNFAASWCLPCQEEMPQLLAFDRTARRYDATILTVTFDPGDVANLRSFLADDHATWPAVADAAADIPWGVSAPPQSFLVNPGGLVSAVFFSGINAKGLDAALAAAEGPTAPSGAAGN
jgi:cytochrome c biogenesis protein CcmG/thiol:disulfide interchange protein DsbE